MIPNVSITKIDGQTGVVRPSVDGVLAIIGPSSDGDFNVAATYTKPNEVLNDFGYGKLADFAAYVMAVARKPVVLIRATTATAATYNDFTVTDTGTSTPTAGATEPNDDFDVVITFVTGGTIATAGGTYKYSLDGGTTFSAVQDLGTNATLTIPNTGVSVDFGAGDTNAGEEITFTTTSAAMTSADLTDALEALRIFSGAWEVMLVVADADSTMVADTDLWLSSREGEGKYRHAIFNTRLRDRVTPETETAYRTSLQAAFASTSSIRCSIGADGGDDVSTLRGIKLPRPTSEGLAARLMAIDVSTDAAQVSDGPISGFFIKDDRNNPKYHDELLYPGLDDLRFTTFRSFDALEGTYITNPLVFSASGSDYVFVQHARVMNKACELAFQLLTQRLSQGIAKAPRTGFPGQYITDEDADEIEGALNSALQAAFVNPTRRVSDIKFILSRTDDLSSNAGAQLTAELQILAKAYIKSFSVQSKFVRSITVTA